MYKQLKNNKLLIILQVEPTGQDLWFAVLGEHVADAPNDEVYGQVHIVEHNEHTCNYSESMSTTRFLNLMNAILTGRKGDRFYGKRGQHTFKVLSFNRRLLSGKVVNDYIR